MKSDRLLGLNELEYLLKIKRTMKKLLDQQLSAAQIVVFIQKKGFTYVSKKAIDQNMWKATQFIRIHPLIEEGIKKVPCFRH